MRKPMAIEDLPQHVIDKMTPEDRAEFGLKTTHEHEKERNENVAKHEEKAEKNIQSAVESYLIHLGYERRTPEDIKRGMSDSGYFIHLHATKRNPIILDLLVLSHAGTYLEIELKTATGKLTPEQECLVSYGGSLARSAEEACAIILEWHNQQRHINRDEEEM